MTVEAGDGSDRNGPPLVEHHAVLDDIQFEGATAGPRRGEGREGAVERRQSFLRQREPPRVTAVPHSLDLPIGQPRRRAHQPPLKPMTPFAAGGVDP